MTHSFRFNRKRVIRNSLCLSVGILCFLILLFFLRPLRVSGTSMAPTLKDGQFLAVTPRALNPFLELQRGDVVIVRHEEGHCLLVKRLIAQPGDTLEIRSNRVYVNGTPIHEPYLREAMVTKDVPPITLGADEYYVLGDNRNVSADSRLYGLFSGEEIYAIADLEQQRLHGFLLIVLLANVFLWATYLPDWDGPYEEQPAAAREAA